VSTIHEIACPPDMEDASVGPERARVPFESGEHDAAFVRLVVVEPVTDTQ
jgi:hypothetical protein